MSFLLGLFGLLTIAAGAFLSLGLLAGEPIGIGGAVLWGCGWLMFGASAILDKQAELVKLIRESTVREPAPATSTSNAPIVNDEGAQRLAARHAGRTSA